MTASDLDRLRIRLVQYLPNDDFFNLLVSKQSWLPLCSHETENTKQIYRKEEILLLVRGVRIIIITSVCKRGKEFFLVLDPCQNSKKYAFELPFWCSLFVSPKYI